MVSLLLVQKESSDVPFPKKKKIRKDSYGSCSTLLQDIWISALYAADQNAFHLPPEHSYV